MHGHLRFKVIVILDYTQSFIHYNQRHMESGRLLRYLIFGQLRRDFILPPQANPSLDILGGSLVYAATGLGIWETGTGLVARAGEDFPQEWLAKIGQQGFDLRGIRILPESIDLRSFAAYTDINTRHFDNPVSHFSRLGLSFPKPLLGYNPPGPQIDSRVTPSPLTIRLGDIPPDYLDSTAAHLCPMDYLSHTLVPPTLRNGHISTITLDPSTGYMNPAFWNEIPAILNGITAFSTSEEKLFCLFQGRSTDPWEMAETLAGYGCEIIVIKRGCNGQYLYDHSNHTRWIIPAYPSRVTDPTGAGNAFCGGFLAGYRNTYSPLQAVLFGNISASLVIEGTGAFYALDALPALAQARVEALQHMVRKA